MNSRLQSIMDDASQMEEKASREFMFIVTDVANMLKDIIPNRRKLWLSQVIKELYHEQKGRCALCDEPLEFGKHHVDHIIPFCYGGGNERSNIQLAHPSCNQKKRAEVDPRDLLSYLEDRYMNM